MSATWYDDDSDILGNLAGDDYDDTMWYDNDDDLYNGDDEYIGDFTQYSGAYNNSTSDESSNPTTINAIDYSLGGTLSGYGTPPVGSLPPVNNTPYLQIGNDVITYGTGNNSTTTQTNPLQQLIGIGISAGNDIATNTSSNSIQKPSVPQPNIPFLPKKSTFPKTITEIQLGSNPLEEYQNSLLDLKNRELDIWKDIEQERIDLQRDLFDQQMDFYNRKLDEEISMFQQQFEFSKEQADRQFQLAQQQLEWSKQIAQQQMDYQNRVLNLQERVYDNQIELSQKQFEMAQEQWQNTLQEYNHIRQVRQNITNNYFA